MVLGIDPGFTGATCLITESGIHSILDIPLLATETLTARHKFRSVDMAALVGQLKPFAHKIQLAVIERVSAMPQQGVASTFRFGQTTGQIEGIVCALGITRTIRPPPAVWKAAMGVTHNKKTSLELARKLAPLHLSELKLAKHDGRAEAFLLALYGARSLGWSSHTGNQGANTSDISSIL